MKKRKILVVTEPLFDGEHRRLGGAQRYAIELVRSLSTRADVTLISFADNEKDRVVDGVPIRFLPAWRVKSQWNNPFTTAVAPYVWAADAVICFQRHTIMSSWLAILGRLTRTPVFVSDLGGGAWDISAYMSTESWYQGHFHISKYSMQLTNPKYSDKHSIIYGGVDSNRFHPGPSYNPSGPVLFVGRILPHKGIDYLIQACADWELQIVGPVIDEDYLGYLKSLSDNQKVTFIHDVTDDSLIKTYQTSSTTVLPSVYEDYLGHTTLVPELLGQTLLEAMSCGVPVICSRVASMPEIVVDQVNGLTVAPNDVYELRCAIETIKKNPATASQMGARGRKDVLERFQWDTVSEKVLSCLFKTS